MGWSEEDLSEDGKTQVQRLSSSLAKLPIESVYTSPLNRVYSTAKTIAEKFRLKPQVTPELIEIDVGKWQGLHIDNIKKEYPEIWAQWRKDPSEFRMPGGESLNEVASRAVSSYHRIVNEVRGKQAVIVSHEVIIKLIVIHVLGAPLSIYRRFEIDNASVSSIRILEHRSAVINLNDTSHLEE